MTVLHKYLFQSPSLSQICGGFVADFLTSSPDAVVSSRDASVLVSCTSRGLVSSSSSSLPGDCHGVVTLADTVIATRGEGIAVLSSTLSIEREFFQPGHQVLCIAASPDGEHFATGGSDASVAVWSLGEGHVRYFNGHSDWVRFVAFINVDGNQQIVSASDDGCSCLWDPKGGHVATLEFSGGVGIRAFDVSGDGTLAIAGEAPNLTIYSIRSNQYILCGVVQKPHTGTLTAARVIPSMHLVASAGEDEIVAVSCVRTFRTLWRCTSLVTRRRCISFMNTVSCIRILACPPSSSVIILLACASDGTVLQWVIDPRDDRSGYTRTLQLHIGSLVGLDVFSPH